jgi:uncharacterized membrane protein YecN with MAPEG domain
MRILPLYAALLALLFVALSVRIVRLRHGLRIAIGDAGDKQMLRAMRVQANFSEYVPLCLLLLYLLEAQGAAAWSLHVLGACLLVGRLVHAFGVSQVRENLRFRITGMALTLGVLVTSAVSLLVRWIRL